MTLSPLSLLVLSAVALAVGPALGTVASAKGPAGRALDGLSLALVGGACLLHVVPHAYEEAGWPALVAAVIGVALPLLAHRSEGSGARWDVAAFALLSFHALLDGAAMAIADASLGVAVIAHRLPVGLAIHAGAQHADTHHLAESRLSATTVGWGAVALLTVATTLGFAGAAIVGDVVPDQALGVFEGLVAGALLHLVLQPGHERHPTPQPWAAIGALAGLGLVAAFGVDPAQQQTLDTFGSLALDIAPALLVAYALMALMERVQPAVSRFLPRLDALLVTLPLLGPVATVARLLADAAGPRPEPLDVREVVHRSLPWVLAGLALASLLAPMLGGDALAGPWLAQVVLAVLVALPFHVGPAGATVIAAMGVRHGLSVGAAIAFVVAAPARWSDGRADVARTAAVALVAGIALDLLGVTEPAPGTGGLVATVCAVGLAGVALFSLWHQGPRGMLDRLRGLSHNHPH